jgi:hypothetical protein
MAVTRLDLIRTRQDLICTRQDLIRTGLDLIRTGLDLIRLYSYLVHCAPLSTIGRVRARRVMKMALERRVGQRDGTR